MLPSDFSQPDDSQEMAVMTMRAFRILVSNKQESLALNVRVLILALVY
jgi:hypothetical protein